MPRVLVQEKRGPISKVEMSAATISALRAMMRDEMKNGMMEMEQRFAGKLDSAIHGIKEELAAEKEALQQLEDRISHLEQHRATRSDNGNILRMMMWRMSKKWRFHRGGLRGSGGNGARF